MTTQILGWGASVVLLVTIGGQAFEQWRTRTNEGVSPFLFVGQLLASTGFVAYSILRGDPVFVVTNALLLVSAALGLFVMWRNRRAEGAPDGPPTVAAPR